MLEDFSKLLAPSDHILEAEASGRKSHPAQVALVADRFRAGIEEVFDEQYRENRLHDFAARQDPIYATLLHGFGDEAVSRPLVENWMIGQTLATKCRFWLEDAIVDLLLHKCASERDPNKRPRIYSYAMLSGGSLTRGESIWDLGERWREQVIRRSGWTQSIGVRALDVIDRIVSHEEAAFDALTSAQRRGPDGIGRLDPMADAKAFADVGNALGGDYRTTQLRCNILVVEPEPPLGSGRITGIRYVNPGTFSAQAKVREERISLLRLGAFLMQEKPLRDPQKIEVCVADIVPRFRHDETKGRERAHFSGLTRWSGDTLWQYIGVPFHAVRAGIRTAGADAAEAIRKANEGRPYYHHRDV